MITQDLRLPLSQKNELAAQSRFCSFELLGSRCEIVDTSQTPIGIDEIMRDLPALVVPVSDLAPDFTIVLEEKPPATSGLKLRTSLGVVQFGWRRRAIDFKDGGRGVFEFAPGARTARFSFDTSPDIVENYMAATWGEILENRGVRRLHAAALLNSDGAAEIYVAPSGAGKSTLIMAMLTRGEKVYSDEIALVSDGITHAFPLPVAGAGSPANSHRKRKFLGSMKPLTAIEASSLAHPSKVGRIFFVTGSMRGLRELEWIFVVTLGLGLPQMKEYLLRTRAFPSLVRAAVRRFAFAIRIIVTGRLVFQSESEFRSRPQISPKRL